MGIHRYQKKYTETLRELLERFRLEHTELKDTKLTYAGRLDPLAEGEMIILSGDDVHKKDEYLKKRKVYTVEILLGVSTDSYDILGIPKQGRELDISLEEIQAKLQELVSYIELPYPAFSSKTVGGVPLYIHAKQGKLEEIDIPNFSVDIDSYELLSIGEAFSLGEYLPSITEIIASVSGDFRQEEIIDSWKSLDREYKVRRLSIRFSVGSGVYIRTLVHEFGMLLTTGASCIKIVRESID